jgi:hypothetical protein
LIWEHKINDEFQAQFGGFRKQHNHLSKPGATEFARVFHCFAGTKVLKRRLADWSIRDDLFKGLATLCRKISRRISTGQ